MHYQCPVRAAVTTETNTPHARNTINADTTKRRTHRRTRPTTHLALQERKELFQAEGAVTVGVEPLDQRPHVLSRQR